MTRSVRGPGDSSLSPYRRRVRPALEIRPVRPAEHRRAGDVTAASYQEFAPPGDADWQRYLARIADVAGRAGHTVVLVALDDGEIVGTATVELDQRVEPDWTEPLAPHEAHLRMVGVHPSRRRQGIGRALVEASVELARAAGKTQLTLETTAKMRAAHAMYTAIGFTPTGTREVAPGFCFDGYQLDLVQPSTVG
jgi:ribosomal protein S18 acetylase RimI-like enzyme